MSERFNYFRGPNGDRWWRAFGYQLGYHPNGRRRLFSERYGYKKPIPTLRLGRREISFTRIKTLEGLR